MTPCLLFFPWGGPGKAVGADALIRPPLTTPGSGNRGQQAANDRPYGCCLMPKRPCGVWRAANDRPYRRGFLMPDA